MADDADPQDLLQHLASIKSAVESLTKQKNDVEARLIAALDTQGKDVLTVKTSQGGVIKGTVVRAERVVIDADALESVLDPKLWAKVTKRVLDNGLLEAHVVTGAIDEDLVAQHSEIKQNKPYVKVSGDLPTIVGIEQVQTVADSGREKPAAKRVKAKKAAAKAAGPK